MSMNWLPQTIFYMGLLDAGLIMLGGVTVAGMLIVGRDVGPLMSRVGPAAGVLIGSSIAAAIVLWITRAVVGV